MIEFETKLVPLSRIKLSFPDGLRIVSRHNTVQKTRLKKSIFKGQLNEVYVYREKNHYCLITGHGRVEALRNGGNRKIRAKILKRKPTTDEMLIFNIIDNKVKQYDPFELAKICLRLHKQGWSMYKLAKRLGYNKSYLNRLLKIANFPAEIKKAMIKKEISFSAVTPLISINDNQERLKYFRKWIEGGCTKTRFSLQKIINKKSISYKSEEQTRLQRLWSIRKFKVTLFSMQNRPPTLEEISELVEIKYNIETLLKKRKAMVTV